MPQYSDKWFIKDTTLNIWCTQYNIILSNCYWGSWEQSSAEFDTENDANAAIIQWGETPGGRYKGDRPIKPPANP